MGGNEGAGAAAPPRGAGLSNDPNRLGVFIPAWKPRHLGEALASLAAQSDVRFNVYVGDDGGAPEIGEIVAGFSGPCRLTDRRFDQHLGSESLVRQWNRCVQLGDEEWVWLFSDDDVADSACVRRFYEELESTSGGYDVYRFCSASIDETGAVVRVHPPHPRDEDPRSFLYHVLLGQRTSPQPEYIFRRRALLAAGGFVDLPLAWATDHATAAKVAGAKGLRCIDGPLVRWRRTAEHVTGRRDAQTAEGKLNGAMAFCEWVPREGVLDGTIPMKGCPDREQTLRALREWALRQWKNFAGGLEAETANGLLTRYAAACGLGVDVLQQAQREASARLADEEMPYLARLSRRLGSGLPRVARVLDSALGVVARAARGTVVRRGL